MTCQRPRWLSLPGWLPALFLLLAAGIPDAHAQMAGDDPYRAGRFDNGKMWTFEYPPLAYLKEAYNFEPDAAWFEHARLGALRIPGCSASFVTATGLVMTNHHCGRGATAAVTGPGENLLENGFYAPSLAEERRAPDMYADQLIAITDVTDEVYAALEGAQTDAERQQARQDAFARIEQRLGGEAGGEAAGVHVEVISLYHGGRYSAYTFRRYTDMRLVMTPELQIGYYGGDADNFTFPRYNLDMTFFRLYGDDGQPLRTDHFFAWSRQGVEEGDLVFVIGNPGSTFRLETVAQLEYRRDVREPAVLAFVRTRADALQAYYDAHPDDPRRDELENQIFGLRNTQKLYEGRVKALNDPVVMARRVDFERSLRAALDADAALQAEYGGLFDRMADVQQQKHDLGAEYGAFLLVTNPTYASATLRRALLAYRFLTEQQSEATDEALARLRDQLRGVNDQPRDLDEPLLALHLADFQTYFGADHELVRQVLQGRAPEAAAQALLDGSALADAASTAAALDAGTLSMDDPAVQVARAFVPRFLDYQSASAGLAAQEEEIAGTLGRARFAVYSTAIPPDATFSLRIADGVVEGYAYNGTIAPPYTTFYGLYDRYYGFGPGTEWDLPERWVSPPATFDLAAPVNFVSTADITGGNSGSPVINRDLEVVGLVFDGNIESLSGDYIYLPQTNRAVAVDARGMLEALDEIYDADRLVLELTGVAFVPTEEEADAVNQ